MNMTAVTGIHTHQLDTRKGITSVRQKPSGHSERVLRHENPWPIQK